MCRTSRTWSSATIRITSSGQFRATLKPNLLLNVNASLSHYTFDAEDTPGNDTKTAWFDRNTKYFGGGSIGPASNYAVYIDPHHLDTTQAMLTFLPHGNILGGSHQIQVGGGSRFVGAGGQVPNHPAGNYQITYDVVGGVAHQPVEIQTFNFPINQPNRGLNGNAFVNDKWELGSRLTFNLGLRYDHDHAYIPPLVEGTGRVWRFGQLPPHRGQHLQQLVASSGRCLRPDRERQDRDQRNVCRLSRRRTERRAL